MSSTDSWWLIFWEWFANIGFSLVIIGCVIEGVEHFVKFKRSESRKRKGIEKFGWLILVAGLAMEFLGDKRAKRIADRENRRLTVEAAQALEEAGKANEQAEELRKSNSALRVEIADLTPREFKNRYRIRERLRLFSGTTILLLGSTNLPQTVQLREELREMLTSAQWKIL